MPPLRLDRGGAGARVLVLLAAALLPAGCEPVYLFTPLPGAERCPLTPANSYWRSDVRSLEVHPSSAVWRASNGPTNSLHPDFGSGTWEGGPIGIPYVVVPGDQPRKPVSFWWPEESEPGPYPIPDDPPIEGGPDSDGDRHILILDKDACELWELYAATPVEGGAAWEAGSGARFDTRSSQLWPDSLTSADASGMAMLPGLVRFEEVASGAIHHAIRMTVPHTRTSYVWPATHEAGESASTSLPPMGAWLRLGAHLDPDQFGPQTRPIVVALQTHGAIVADNGSSWFLSGAPDERWDNDQLRQLRAIHGTDFDFVDAQPMKVADGSGESRLAR
jgi:hypothetical protein